ncbi:hypothetical protein MPTK1_7g18700 [Marchantia polymorpha subsp. ruderalis]|uniref:Uncharacterized protein n=2 Tax=Marchantia polymorpha TaxID=3197 RepID=A0AAF6C165_MARPO|nr:hypothetical protein MARPO_0067s0107 [Marchantia polymorpha]BBN17999.1 hypothetical protein Mp_7g18700 [Marchantia polymorpha subsp. ruderalis]|eukprot:PTQ36036.1 hypothetical protein MARPO_0067s0107 [Marchantia polymorpha]
MFCRRANPRTPKKPIYATKISNTHRRKLKKLRVSRRSKRENRTKSRSRYGPSSSISSTISRICSLLTFNYRKIL